MSDNQNILFEMAKNYEPLAREIVAKTPELAVTLVSIALLMSKMFGADYKTEGK